jgi:phosphoribosylanthranilate isomerase
MSGEKGARVRVKICGITTPEDGLMAVHAGADAIGLVFWPKSPRFVDAAHARAIAQALPPFVLRVGVFVDPSPQVVAEAVEAAGLDLLQLHGAEPPDAFAALPRRALKALRVGEDFDLAQALKYEGRAAGLLVDTQSSRGLGGTGETFDWTLVRELRQKTSFLVLAGGLVPGNVAQAIAAVRPDAVDVSSGVERAPGEKDPEKVRAFIAAVREGA